MQPLMRLQQLGDFAGGFRKRRVADREDSSCFAMDRGRWPSETCAQSNISRGFRHARRDGRVQLGKSTCWVGATGECHIRCPSRQPADVDEVRAFVDHLARCFGKLSYRDAGL
jgi:hypothetical protein